GGEKLQTLVDGTVRGGVVRYARAEIKAIASAGAARRADPLPGYVPISRVRREQRCSYDTLRREVPGYHRIKREALVDGKSPRQRQYQILLPEAAVRAFIAKRRAQKPAKGHSIDEARKQLLARWLCVSRAWLTRLCRALGVKKRFYRSTSAGRGKGRRRAYLLSAGDIARIEDALRRASSIRDAARLLRRAERKEKKGATSRRDRARA